MHYKLLGPTGLRVSELCLGTMTFGEDWGWGASLEECRKLLNTFMDHGGNFIDTANFYTGGSSESILGELCKGIREKLVIATKYSLNTDPDNNINAGGNHRKNMVRAVEQSLTRLQTDYIDLYQLHVWDQVTPVEEVMRAMDDLVSAGKVVYAGISDTPAWVVAKGNMLAECRGWTKFASLQYEYNLLQRGIERELLPMAKHDDLALLVWSPLASGILSGKYRSLEDKGKSGRGGFADNYVTENNLRIIDTLVAVAQEVNATPASVALRWLQYQYHGVFPIVGARKLEQLEDNLSSVTVNLDASQLQRLNEISFVPPGFPYDMITDNPPTPHNVPQLINGKFKEDVHAEIARRSVRR